ncbi:unnamed protein product [Cunninghamella echinulata]
MVWFILMALKPFHSSQDQVKYIFLTGVAFITASLWDNYIVYHRAWWYCPKCVTAVIGYVPLEEYMFFIIMTMITVPFTNLIMRWQLPTFYLKSTSSSFQFMCTRYLPIIGFLVIAKKAWNVAIPNTPLFYGGCILWYVCPVLALLWFGAGEYICRRWKSVMISITFPTLYLCWVDKIAIRAGTWHISEKTSTQIMVVPNLPIEEFLFFFLINVVLVFATCAIDRAYAVLHLYKSNDSRQQQQQQQFNSTFISLIFSFLMTMKDLTWAFCQSDQDLDPLPLKDLTTTWNILKHGSASFYTASTVFPNQVRQDLGILYGFCRATDDLADNENISITHRQQQLYMVRQFIHDLFLQKSNCSQAMDWTSYQQVLPSDCLASFRSFVRLRHMLQPEAIHELLDGYIWDLERRPIQHEQDLKTYSACVASSVGEMCTRIILSHQHQHQHHFDNQMNSSIMHDTIEKAREMGLVLQYTNIARDIVTDSQQLGRCYIPLTWLKNNELELIKTRQARKVGDTRLKEWALKLIQEAELSQVRASKGILNLPKDCQGGVRAACAVYCAIGQVLKLADGYPTRAHVKDFHRILIALSSVYDLPSPSSSSSNKLPHMLPSIQSLLNPPSQFNQSPPHSQTQTKPQPPSLQVLPPSPIDTSALSPTLSPALSSTRSPSICSIEPPSPTLMNLSEMNLSELPPIHGDDPPRRLIHSPPTKHSSLSSPSSTSHQYLQRSNKWSDYSSTSGHHHHHHHNYYTTTTTATNTNNQSPSSPTPSHHHERSFSSSSSISSTSSSSNQSSQLLSPPSLSPPKIIISPSTSSSKINNNNNKRMNSSSQSNEKEEVPAPPPCTQILISPTGQPILKRRRGRPPTRSPGYDEGGWTFLSPTVWDVNSSSSNNGQQQSQNDQQQQQQQQQDNINQQKNHNHNEDEHGGMMNNSMTAFTSSNMDTVLPMPKKKRGRKPKTYIEGNSCFVWKDITSRRSVPNTSTTNNNNNNKVTPMEL